MQSAHAVRVADRNLARPDPDVSIAWPTSRFSSIDSRSTFPSRGRHRRGVSAGGRRPPHRGAGPFRRARRPSRPDWAGACRLVDRL